jgi:hypothetical protein
LLKQLNKEKDLTTIKQEFSKQTKFNMSGLDDKKSTLLNYKRKNLSEKKISSYASGTSSKKRSSNRLEID